MKFTLPRQTLTPEIAAIMTREIKKQKIDISRATKKNLIELAQVLKTIHETGSLPDLICKQLPHDLGSGIFLSPTAKPIRKGQVIAPYAGYLSFMPQNDPEDGTYAFTPICGILLTKEEQALFDKTRRWHPRRLYDLKLCAQERGNLTRFVNHSSTPNVDSYSMSVPKNPYGVEPSPIEVIYFANKTIHPGEQLLTCYEDDEATYWGVMKVKPFPMTPKTFMLSSDLKLVT